MMTMQLRWMGDHVQAVCQREKCDWRGVMYSTRTVEGQTLAERDMCEHDDAHESRRGFFHYQRGWVVECANGCGLLLTPSPDSDGCGMCLNCTLNARAAS